MIVGNEGVGKTSIVKRMKLEWNEEDEKRIRNKTDGIEMHQWKPPVKTFSKYRSKSEEKEKQMEMMIWDFAGQEIYYLTHQFFLTKEAVRKKKKMNFKMRLKKKYFYFLFFAFFFHN